MYTALEVVYVLNDIKKINKRIERLEKRYNKKLLKLKKKKYHLQAVNDIEKIKQERK